MSSETIKQVDLGFAEECDSVLLRNVYFPSKIGGKPAWLDLDAIPSTEELQCKICAAPKSFLCQVYAPIEDNPECFHRVIYLFICREPNCFKRNSAENFSAFRSQLPRQNKFYSAAPPNDDDELDAIPPSCKICTVCGCRGSLMCSRCKNANYCGAKHQRAHWPQHKRNCRLGSQTKESDEGASILLINFPELEIVIALDTVVSDGSERNDDDEAEKRRLEDFKELVEQRKTGTMDDLPEAELKKFATAEENDDESFRRFIDIIATNPAQILRYDIGGEPLWIADVDKTIGSVDIPPCTICNSERQFEFQIMPQMINYLKDDNIDWGVLAVYTCKKSCSGEGVYAREFIVKQDIISEDK